MTVRGPRGGRAARAAALAAFVLASAAAPPVAGAQRRERPDAGGVWLVVPTVSAETAGLAVETAPILQRELRRLSGVRAMPLLVAKDRFEARDSMEPVATDESDLDLVAREAQAALVHVATGRNSEARAAVGRVLERAESALESLNRETTSARKVLDACLYLVRAMMDAGNTSAARTRVLECRRLVPDIAPDPADHPPSVLRLLDEAEAELRRSSPGELRVESDPPGCAFYLNGRHLGATPFQIASLPPGEYRVQVECAGTRLSRVHRLVLASEPTRMAIDSRFDAVVRSRELLSLSYPSAAEEEGHRVPDARHLARVVEAEQIVLVTAVGPDVLRLDRLPADGGPVVATARVPVTGRPRDDRAVVARAAAALRAGRSFDFTAEPPREITPWVAPPTPARPPAPVAAVAATPTPPADDAEAADAPAPAPAPADAPPSRRGAAIAGGVLLALGVGAYVGSWALWAELRGRGDDLEGLAATQVGFLDAQARFDDLRLPTALVGLGGGLLATTAVPLALVEADGVPWWSWVIGVVGLGGVVGGAAWMATEGACLDASCTRREPNAVLGTLIAAHGAPLLAVPLTHLIREATGGDARATVAMDGRGARVTLRATF